MLYKTKGKLDILNLDVVECYELGCIVMRRRSLWLDFVIDRFSELTTKIGQWSP